MYLTPNVDGTYYIDVGGYLYSRLVPRAYALSVTTEDRLDLPADTSTEATVAVGGSTVVTIDRPGDVDWIKVGLTAGRRYDIYAPRYKQVAFSDLGRPHIRSIYDSSGQRQLDIVQGNHGVGYVWLPWLYFVPETSGEYYIEATGDTWEAAVFQNRLDSGYAGSYTLAVEVSNVKDVANDATTTAVSTIGEATRSRIDHRGDLDWIRMELEQGKRYRIDLKGASSSGGWLLDPIIFRVLDSNGQALPNTNDDDSGYLRDSLVFFEPPHTGEYFVEVGGKSHVGTYTVYPQSTEEIRVAAC